MTRLLAALVAALALAAGPAAAQIKIGLIVSATGPTTAIGQPQKNTGDILPTRAGDATDERARVLVTVKNGKFRLLPE